MGEGRCAASNVYDAFEIARRSTFEDIIHCDLETVEIFSREINMTFPVMIFREYSFLREQIFTDVSIRVGS